ncbi:hypothetical protein Hte_011974 [Hypoxylon texense]
MSTTPRSLSPTKSSPTKNGTALNQSMMVELPTQLGDDTEPIEPVEDVTVKLFSQPQSPSRTQAQAIKGEQQSQDLSLVRNVERPRQTRTPEPQNRRSNRSEMQSPGHIAAFDWEDFENRYTKALQEADEQEKVLLEEFDNLVKASSTHDNERAVKRLQTRERHVRLSEQTLSQKKKHPVYHVSTDAAILKRLRDELAQAAADEPNGGDIAALHRYEQLPFLTAVIMEGLRLSPGIGGRSPRIAPDRELVCGDKWRIPAGTPVGTIVSMMHLDEALYPNPYRFGPEPWMRPDARKKAEKMFAPFSRGSRICLGMQFAYLQILELTWFAFAWAESYLVVSTLVRKFDFNFTGVETDHFEWTSDQFTVRN